MNEERTVTITTDEYKVLIEEAIRLEMVIELVTSEEERAYSSVRKEDLCRLLGIKLKEEEKA